ncbi:putative quinol monooxygenase [Metabacillus indicus]|uniref:putative quinol monooxygenase n=1 Tax=Metabacillus indicus TaxID=246786 RepID=UPI0031787B36
MIIIHAGFKVLSEKEADFLSEIRPLVAASREEDGNISYDLMKDTETAGTYKMIELWKDAQAVELHNSSEHFKAFSGKAMQFLAAPPEVKLFNGEQVKS